ncbi:putative Glycosyl transferase, group 1 [Bradyrhizobium sp. ORS 285]|uniref:glycosyltransferase n=1 Tax=Bradyrhizobium sp. ORS 285 TaxID=115808 RepID=UPI0002407968|nr:glycosyltransferase [Bradyrhizobium sp. ORS 285]CCD89072.1 putative Glycosyl transferase, group 1 [Bradyrhizobium sp. ORS 285]SMX61784.1 putative Glycosyl transferase, group 1 [Bradyrhizobium sp. ORS 285]
MSSRRLRIVSIAHPATSSEAGRLRYRFLASRPDVDLHLVMPEVWKEFGRTIQAPPSDDGFPVHRLPIRLPEAGPMKWYLHFYPALRRLLRELDPDVIHLWEEPWSIVALQAQLLRGRAALVLEVDQNILKRLPPPFEAIRKFVLGRTDHILSRSPDATEVVRARGYAGPVTPIGYGVDLATFTPAEAPAPHRADAPLRFGYVGRLVVEKGLDDALEALARSPSAATLSIMGEGPHETHLRQRVEELGLRGRVEFQGWAAPAEVAAFLRSLDALLLLTRTTNTVREQFGRVIIEAQACGIPVIGSTCGAIPDVIGDGGWIVPEQDPERLSRLLDQLSADRTQFAARSQAARANVLKRFTYDAVATAIEAACRAADQSRNASRLAAPRPLRAS